MGDLSHELQLRVQQAIEECSPIEIRGGNSKRFYGREVMATPLDVAGHSGIISYEPTELVVTVRAGTPLAELEAVLAEQGQMLPFEPPAFDDAATIGGTIACNLSGPRRPYAGAARDFVLGARILNGKGEILHFGGEVMKNVAGYDLSRLMAGAMGTLGILLDVSLKVLPRPEVEITLVHSGLNAEEALQQCHAFGRQPLPVSAIAFCREQLSLRLSGTRRGVEAAVDVIGGEQISQDESDAFWQAIKNHKHDFFSDERPLWRLSLPATTPPLPCDSEVLYEWGGVQRWIHSEKPAEAIFALVKEYGGHATAYRRQADREQVFQPLDDGLRKLHHNLKRATDPHGILNPGRLYAGL
jgi:glycolate oxidase FAD binding subunit